MTKITEILLRQPLKENITNDVTYALTTADSALLNFMEDNFEDDITEMPLICRLNIPTWLNLWCIFISICVLTLLIVLGVLLRYVQVQKQRVIRSEVVHVSPDFYSEHFLDRSQIMVY